MFTETAWLTPETMTAVRYSIAAMGALSVLALVSIMAMDICQRRK